MGDLIDERGEDRYRTLDEYLCGAGPDRGPRAQRVLDYLREQGLRAW